jgi:hypothetical protein
VGLPVTDDVQELELSWLSVPGVAV